MNQNDTPASDLAKAIVSVKQSMRRTKSGKQVTVAAHEEHVSKTALAAGLAKLKAQGNVESYSGAKSALSSYNSPGRTSSPTIHQTDDGKVHLAHNGAARKHLKAMGAKQLGVIDLNAAAKSASPKKVAATSKQAPIKGGKTDLSSLSDRDLIAHIHNAREDMNMTRDKFGRGQATSRDIDVAETHSRRLGEESIKRGIHNYPHATKGPGVRSYEKDGKVLAEHADGQRVKATTPTPNTGTQKGADTAKLAKMSDRHLAASAHNASEDLREHHFTGSGDEAFHQKKQALADHHEEMIRRGLHNYPHATKGWGVRSFEKDGQVVATHYVGKRAVAAKDETTKRAPGKAAGTPAKKAGPLKQAIAKKAPVKAAEPTEPPPGSRESRFTKEGYHKGGRPVKVTQRDILHQLGEAGASKNGRAAMAAKAKELHAKHPEHSAYIAKHTGIPAPARSTEKAAIAKEPSTKVVAKTQEAIAKKKAGDVEGAKATLREARGIQKQEKRAPKPSPKSPAKKVDSPIQEAIAAHKATADRVAAATVKLGAAKAKHGEDHATTQAAYGEHSKAHDQMRAAEKKVAEHGVRAIQQRPGVYHYNAAGGKTVDTHTSPDAPKLSGKAATERQARAIDAHKKATDTFSAATNHLAETKAKHGVNHAKTQAAFKAHGKAFDAMQRAAKDVTQTGVGVHPQGGGRIHYHGAQGDLLSTHAGPAAPAKPRGESTEANRFHGELKAMATGMKAKGAGVDEIHDAMISHADTHGDDDGNSKERRSAANSALYKLKTGDKAFHDQIGFPEGAKGSHTDGVRSATQAARDRKEDVIANHHNALNHYREGVGSQADVAHAEKRLKLAGVKHELKQNGYAAHPETGEDTQVHYTSAATGKHLGTHRVSKLGTASHYPATEFHGVATRGGGKITVKDNGYKDYHVKVHAKGGQVVYESKHAGHHEAHAIVAGYADRGEHAKKTAQLWHQGAEPMRKSEAPDAPLVKSLAQMPRLSFLHGEAVELVGHPGGASDRTPRGLRDGFVKPEEAMEKALAFAKGGFATYVYHGGGRYHLTVDAPPTKRHHEGKGFVEFAKSTAAATSYLYDAAMGGCVGQAYHPGHLGLPG